jgi:hypothetical protein
MGEDLTKRYKKDGYAIYIPSLQKPYALSAIKADNDIREGHFSRLGNGVGFHNKDLDFLNPKSQLWSCGYTLYSSGQFSSSVINPDMVTERDRKKTIVVGDSGGYQLGSGKITSPEESKALKKLAHTPHDLIAQWDQIGFRKRTLNWLDAYCDYSMTLDAVLWGSNDSITDPNLWASNKSVFRNCSTQQLIDLTVANNRYFETNRRSGGTKFLNVLQELDNVSGSGEAWYQAVKDFKFEGWAYGGSTKMLSNMLGWLHRLKRENRLDKSEWIHILQASPPKFSVIYSAIQRALRKSLNSDITISYDSSSPHQGAGKNRAMYKPFNPTGDLKSWRLGSVKIEQRLQLARGIIRDPLPVPSPLSRFGFESGDLNWHLETYRDRRVDAFSEHLLTNHNIYTFHKAALDSCDLVFKPRKEAGLVPAELDDFVRMMDDFFEL